jgi:uncharacterized membrane protein YkvA (DUF1232 family)
VVVTIAAYALGPIGLIPDLISMFGYLDDVPLVPAGIWLTIRLTPKILLEEFRQQPAELAERPASIGAAMVIVMIWLLSISTV